MLDVPVAEVKSRHTPSYILNMCISLKLRIIILETIKTELFYESSSNLNNQMTPSEQALILGRKNSGIRDGQPSVYKHHFAFIFQNA